MYRVLRRTLFDKVLEVRFSISFAARFCGRFRKRKVLGSEGLGKKVSVGFCCSNAKGKRFASACCVTRVRILRFLAKKVSADVTDRANFGRSEP